MSTTATAEDLAARVDAVTAGAEAPAMEGGGLGGRQGGRGALVCIESRVELRQWSERCRAAGMVVGLVPTMGALHAGHTSLIRRARVECDRVAVSIFVNPLQFGPAEGYTTYPRDLGGDLRQLAAEGVDVAFVPTVPTMYPVDHATDVLVRGPLTAGLEGACRPGHFAGVALVVARLLALARPDRAYFGAKDAQQCAVVRRLTLDLDLGAEIVVCPTARDVDGLALSSRNRLLSAEERVAAAAIPRALDGVAERFRAGCRDVPALTAPADAELVAAGLSPDYVAIVNPDTFDPVGVASPADHCLIAARAGRVRLLDGIRLDGDEPASRMGGALA